MASELITGQSGSLTTPVGVAGLPSLIVRAGGGAERRFMEFFAAQIRNGNTREAYQWATNSSAALSTVGALRGVGARHHANGLG